MGRPALRRGGLAAAVSALTVAVTAAGSMYVVPDSSGGTTHAATAAATSAGTTEILLNDPSRETRRSDRLLAAGETGFLHRQGGVTGLLWTNYADGGTVTVQGPSGVYRPIGGTCYYISDPCPSGRYGQGADLAALPDQYDDKVSLWSPDGSAPRTVVVAPDDYVGTYGSTVVLADWNAVIDAEAVDGTMLKLVDFVGGEQRERWVTGYPSAEAEWQTGMFRRTGDKDGALLAYPVYGASGVVESYTIGYLDFATARFTVAFTGADPMPELELVLTGDRVGWYTAASGLHLKPRTDLTAEETVPVAAGSTSGSADPELVGDWLLLTGSGGVTAVSLTDGSTRDLLPRAFGNALATPDGAALVTGGTDAADWWVQRVTEGSDGAPRLEKLYKVPPYETVKTGLALSRGSLRVVTDNPKGSDPTSVRTLTTNGGTTLTASAATAGDSIGARCPYIGAGCSMLWGNTGTHPRDVYLGRAWDSYTKDGLVSLRDGSSDSHLEFGTKDGAIVDVSDGYAVYNSGGATPTQYVGEFGQGQKLKRSVRAAALNGSTLWSATTTAGKLTSYSLARNKTLATVTVPGLGCVPSELQAAGRWVYWACGTASAGVYDSKARTSKPVTPGDVLLGDGFTVRHDHAADRLVLTEAATGTTRVIASGLADYDLDSGLDVDRRFRWTVDEYTGLVAWFDSYDQTHVATTGIAPSGVSAFETKVDSYVSPASSATSWDGRWLLSRPVTSWSLTLASVQSGESGKVATRTLTDGATRAWMSANWNGKTAGGARFPSGLFRWTLKATGLGTSAPVTVTSGTGYLENGAAVRHDFDSVEGTPDGDGDLVTLNSSGTLTYHLGTGGGRFGDRTTGTGWATTIKVIPFGNLGGDRCNDFLVRMKSGALRLYKPGCGAALKPKTRYTTLARSGWNQYNAFTSPGDLTGDGRADLITRKASTGAVYLHKGTSTGRLAARVKLYSNWKGAKQIVGVGDITGDGKADLLVQDRYNNLYRYSGKGNGRFAPRVKLFSRWGRWYNAVVGVGDLNRDGRPDLVARGTSGNLFRFYGNGKGSFGPRTKIGTGWGGYKFLA
ncbi:FG-GAP repeat domain-containing protein [Streptomyces sp. NPDC002845]